MNLARSVVVLTAFQNFLTVRTALSDNDSDCASGMKVVCHPKEYSTHFMIFICFFIKFVLYYENLTHIGCHRL